MVVVERYRRKDGELVLPLGHGLMMSTNDSKKVWSCTDEIGRDVLHILELDLRSW